MPIAAFQRAARRTMDQSALEFGYSPSGVKTDNPEGCEKVAGGRSEA